LSTSPQTAEVAASPDAVPEWKQEVNARLSAHRNRRGAFSGRQPSLPGMESPAPASRTATVAARIAERYAKVPTYSELLAAEAAKAARAAEQAALAARAAQQAAEAINDVLRADVQSSLEEGSQTTQPSPMVAPRTNPAPEPRYRIDPASLPVARRNDHSQHEPRSTVDPYPRIVDPLEEALVAPAQPLPARVLEFPRELVAARKARPRLAEGPLRDTEDQEKIQLRIFEVEPDAISHQPAPAAPENTLLPEWSTIRLDATPLYTEFEMSAGSKTAEESMYARQSAPAGRNAPSSSRAGRRDGSRDGSARPGSSLGEMLPLKLAPMGDRLMASVVDAALILFAFLLFLLVFVACTAHPPTGKPAIIASAVALAGFAALYQWLFFTYAESTPGMRYAKIALCTFDDKNPGRKTLQRRVGALFLAALPLGLGFLWAFLDDDRLGWHDRMTQTYQRSYR
jgi:uncharacterized RDD family membrane protein YckC